MKTLPKEGRRILKHLLTLAFLVFPLIARASVQTYKYHPSVERSGLYSVSIDGSDQVVLTTDEPDFVCFGLSGKTLVDIKYNGEIKEVTVRPVSKNYSYTFDGNSIHLYLEPLDQVSVEVNGDIAKPLFIFANPLEKKPKFSKKDNVLIYKAGNIYEEGKLELSPLQSVYIEPGAIVRGAIFGLTSNNVNISGYGVFDSRVDDHNRGIMIRKSHGINISGPVLLNATQWSTAIIECENVNVNNLKVIATRSIRKAGHENDGIHLFGTSNAKVTHCFAYAHDDAFVCNSRSDKYGWSAEVRNVLFEDCIGWNYRAGNTFEIGYATRENMSDITYRNIYAIHSNTFEIGGKVGKGAIGMHHGSNSTINNVKYENVYIEDPWYMAIHFVILKTTYDNIPDWEGGHINNVEFKNVHILKNGRSLSEFYGVDAAHAISGVLFDGLYFDNKKVESLDGAVFGRYDFITDTVFK